MSTSAPPTTTTASDAVVDIADASPPNPPRRRRRRRALLGAGAVVTVAAVAALAVTTPFADDPPTNATPPDSGASTSLATVEQQTLTARTSESGRLGYDATYTVPNRLRGTLTGLPATGDVVERGGVLYRVDGKPVVLLSGPLPLYRALDQGLEGPDVVQLNANLVALGYGADVGLDPASDDFTWRTREALEDFQADLDVDETGSLAMSDAVFLPEALRVSKVTGALGDEAGGSVVSGTSTRRIITVALDATEQTAVKEGDGVTIVLPDGTSTPGVVSSVGTVATPGEEDQPATIVVEVTPKDPAATGRLDQAPVDVEIVTDKAADALVVPVNALLSLAGGGYAVEVVDANRRHHLVPVELGLFDDSAGLVQVTGPDVKAGQRVVVPSS